jgi:hypothetical protein
MYRRAEPFEGITMRKAIAIRSLLFSLVLLALSQVGKGQVAISVSFGPPPIPVYEQPICPAEGYIWTPGFWDYDEEDGYYWVPGTWVEAPEPGYLWTPGYWGWGNGVYLFHEGYWGPHVGFYGGINYGYGYFGNGYEGGRWDRGRFYYNTSVNRVNVTVIHNTYNTRIVERNNNRISYNGGRGGVVRGPSAQEETYGRERHVERVAVQREHIQQARSNPALRASNNRGKPPIAATERPGDFHGGAVAARKAGGSYKAPPGKALAYTTNGRSNNAAPPANTARPAPNVQPNPNGHAGGLQTHAYTPQQTGNPKVDQRYQQQQQKLAQKQNQEHLRLQQQQQQEDQKLMKRNADEARRQQVEQRHVQQTQHLEQKHTNQEQHVQQRQQPNANAAKPAENHQQGTRPH